MSFQVVPLTATVPLDVCKAQAEGSAMQAVAQSAATAVQDATDMMRAVEQLAIAGASVLTAKFAEDENPQHLTNATDLIEKLTGASSSAFATIGANASTVLGEFTGT